MTSKERFEMEYLCDDEKYLQYYCDDLAEEYLLKKEMSYDSDCWLFNRPADGLEDCYDEDSMP